MTPDVLVIGSINYDLTVLAPHHPRPGETVLGTGHFTAAGGKGANQAVAAARMGAAVAMVGMVGSDSSGKTLLDSLLAAGVDVTGVGVDRQAPTGLAVITVDERGVNSIGVSPGANQRVDPGCIERHRQLVADAAVCLMQLEIPLATVRKASQVAKGRIILNAAPAQSLPSEILVRLDALVVNESELGHLTGSEDIGALQTIDGPGSVVVTVGEDGAVFSRDGATYRCPAPDVRVVDTTGAGDAFCGALAASLATGVPFPDAIRRAVAAGSLATTKEGAQPSMPWADEVEALLDETGPVAAF